MKAMILSAGLGTRLQPFSLLRPKPLFPVLDEPLLLRITRQLRRHGFGPLVVNAHHLRDQIAAALAAEEDVILQFEEKEMGTGGGLRLALPHFGVEPVLIVNGDIVHTIDLFQVYEHHRAAGNAVTLVLHDNPRFNVVEVGSDGRILGFGKSAAAPGGQRLAFTGIHVLDPAVLRTIPENMFYNIIDCYTALIRRGILVRGLVARQHFWTDMGTPEDYLALHGSLLSNETEFLSGLAGDRHPFYVGERVRQGKDVLFNDWVCIGSGAQIGAGASLSRVVVWDGATVPAGASFADTVLAE